MDAKYFMLIFLIFQIYIYIFLPSHVKSHVCSLLGHAMMRGWINNGVDFHSPKRNFRF